MKVLTYIFTITCATLWLNVGHAQQVQSTDAQQHWVDSVFQSLDQDQRIGQLFMVATYSNQGESHQKSIDKLIKNYHLGGLIFFQGGPQRQAALTNHYQSLAKVPLLIAMDAEWGLGMRLDSTISFPRQMTLGAIEDHRELYRMGLEIGRQSNRLGVHINFAPVVDINTNPRNPVIGTRSFGQDKYNVAKKGTAYMQGLEAQQVMATAKHFPGHGDTGSDSHFTMPVIKHDRQRIMQEELLPFKAMISQGLRSTMVAHLHIPSLDDTPNLPATLSKKIINDLLQDQMGFEGLVFTDALNMKGVSQFYRPGALEVKALQAGNDVLLYSEDIPAGVEAIKAAIAKGSLSQQRIDKSVKKILAAKFRAGLNRYQPVNQDNLVTYLNRPEAQLLNRRLYEKSLTVVKNKGGAIPIKVLDTAFFASVSIGTATESDFQKRLSKYAPFSHYNLSNKTSRELPKAFE